MSERSRLGRPVGDEGDEVRKGNHADRSRVVRLDGADPQKQERDRQIRPKRNAVAAHVEHDAAEEDRAEGELSRDLIGERRRVADERERIEEAATRAQTAAHRGPSAGMMRRARRAKNRETLGSEHQLRVTRKPLVAKNSSTPIVPSVCRLSGSARPLSGNESASQPASPSYLTSWSILNIGRYIEMTMTPTMQPTPIIISGSMIEVSAEIDASTSSS